MVDDEYKYDWVIESIELARDFFAVIGIVTTMMFTVGYAWGLLA